MRETLRYIKNIGKNLNPALLERRIIGNEIRRKGARVVELGDGSDSELERIINESLLRFEPGQSKPLESELDQSIFSPYERQLILSDRSNYQVLTIIDFDGVFIDPFGAIFSRRKRTISLDDFRKLREISDRSDVACIITSRIDPDLIREKFPFLRWLVNIFKRSGIYNFPFFNQSAVTKLEKRSKGKLTVLVGKSLSISKRVEQIEEIIRNYLGDNLDNSNGSNNFVIYIIGSSHFDREVVLRLCERNPDWAQRIVFFDTGHLLL